MNYPHTNISAIPISAQTIIYAPYYYVSPYQPIPQEFGRFLYPNMPCSGWPPSANEQPVDVHMLFPRDASRQCLRNASTMADPGLDCQLDHLKKVVLSQPKAENLDRREPYSPNEEIKLGPLTAHAASTQLPSVQHTFFNSIQQQYRPQYNQEVNKSDADLKLEKKVGKYTVAERRLKIRKYKEKLVKWRLGHPLSRKFDGRKKIAFAKYRRNGRFAKKS